MTDSDTDLPRRVRRGLAIVATFLLGGVAAGAVWEWLWTPPGGVVYHRQFVLTVRGMPQEFSGTGTYVIVAAVTGVVLAAAIAWLCHGDELVTLAMVMVAAAAAGVVMALVGHALGPPDPAPLAAVKPQWTRLPDDLRVVGSSPWLALPAGAVVGVLVVFLADFWRTAESPARVEPPR